MVLPILLFYTNTAFGYSALASNNGPSGANNTAIGYQALSNNATGEYNTAIGYNSGPSGSNLNHTTAIGYNAIPTASNQIMMGTATETVNIPGAINSGSTGVSSTGTSGTIFTGSKSLFAIVTATDNTLSGSNNNSGCAWYAYGKGGIKQILNEFGSVSPPTLEYDGLTNSFNINNSSTSAPILVSWLFLQQS